MANSEWQELLQASFVLHKPSGTIKKLARFHTDNVAFIDNFPIPERYEYGNYSRNGLAVAKIFPKTKSGRMALIKAISDLPDELNYLRQ